MKQFLLFGLSIILLTVAHAQSKPDPTKAPQTEEQTKTVDDQIKVSREIRIVVVGASMTNLSVGWGPGFCNEFLGAVECFNTSKNGRSSKSYRDEGWWDRTLALKPNYILIDFGGNDVPGKGPARETDPKTTFYANMKQYVLDARAAGAIPVLVTPLPRRNYRDGKFIHDMDDYAAAVRKVGLDTNTPVIDLHARATALLETLTPAQVLTLDYMATPTSKPDPAHMSPKGIALFGGYAAEDFAKVVPAMAKYVHILTAN